ncbi:MAG TPA: SDR family oxidoreductase, partial [Aliarcobacter cryaerophilus]|nr:SDR family oxidoreductase [Aliarcobacter cryaerophilus]
MIDKKEFLLQSIIKAYIEHLEPIGSKELKSMYELDYSPATIRGYFKKLGDEGFLAQEHISSGRTPTNEALKQYWIGKLNFSISGVNIKAIEFLANKIGVTVFLKKEKSDILQNIINVENRYIILEFTTFVVNIKFNPALYKNPETDAPIQYSIAKSALIHLTKELAVRFADKNIQVNAISYGG